jgi:ectoine hydroxylase-related dioxygenase (phytanoyl-CoA dioxygenase family)
MFTLPGQVELLDDAWLDAARRFLEREVPAEGPSPFTLSECFTDAPPHLGFADDVASWTLRWDGTTVNVDRGAALDADIVVEGTYQAALTAAQQVGFGRPGGAEAAWREVVQQHGKDAMRVRGRVVDVALSTLLDRLHDHLARRTVENPDIHHRATAQGLTDHIRHMQEHGYAVVERAISSEFADELRDTTLRVLAEHGVGSLQWMLYQGRPFERLAQQSQLMTLIDASLGRGAVIASLSAIRKGPGPGTIPLHTDYAHVPEPYPEWAMTGVGVWALEDWTEAAGPTWVVPGSHRLRRGPRPGEAIEGGIPIEMPKGSVVFFTEGLWHWQGDRTEPGERVTLHWHFNRGILRSLEPKKSDEQLLHRNSPRLAEMLGQHDWFDKMSGIGRDHEKFGHMLQLHAFTKKQLASILEDDAKD